MLGYSDERLEALCSKTVHDGFIQVKLKVGTMLNDDNRRCAIARRAVGDNAGIAIEANWVWNVPPAVGCFRELALFRLA